MNFSTLSVPVRLRGVAALSLAALLGALGLQHLLGWLPCSLCSLQRVAFMLVFVAALAGGLAPGAFAAPGRFLASLGALAGLVFALQHLWLLWGPPATTCGDGLRHFVDRMVEALPGSDWLLAGVVPCENASNLLLGMPLPLWTAGLCAGALAVLWWPVRR